MNIDKVIEYARSLGYDGAEHRGAWKHYEVYEPTSTEYTEPVSIGKPVFLFAEKDVVFMASEDEAFEYIDSLPDEEDGTIGKTFSEILKFNDKHDPKTGRFAPKNGGGASSSGVAFTPAGTIAEAREYAKTKLGFSGTVDYSYSYIDQKEGRQVCGTLDIDTVNQINKTITEIQDQYPELNGYVKNLVCANYPGGYAKIVHSGYDATASLAIGAQAYKNGFESVNKSYKEDVDIGYHPKGTDGSAILWHEYGHAYAATKNKAALGSQATTPNIISAIQNSTAETGWLNSAANKLSADPASYGNNISRYATMNHSELFAEAFAAQNTGNGTKWTKAIMEAAGA